MSFSFSQENQEILEQVAREPRFRAITTIPLIAPIPITLIAFVYLAFFVSCALFWQGLLRLGSTMAVNGILVYAAFTPLHDAVHRSISSNRMLNDLLGTLSCFMLLPGITTVISGEPLHRDAIMSAAERNENTKMCVCVGRAKSGQLVLDV